MLEIYFVHDRQEDPAPRKRELEAAGFRVTCFESGAERNFDPLCRTILVMMTTRRPRVRVDRDRAARLPRPNVERPAEFALRPKPLPR